MEEHACPSTERRTRGSCVLRNKHVLKNEFAYWFAPKDVWCTCDANSLHHGLLLQRASVWIGKLIQALYTIDCASDDLGITPETPLSTYGPARSPPKDPAAVFARK